MLLANMYVYLIFPCSPDVASCINILIRKVSANYCKFSNLDQTFYCNWCHKYLFLIYFTLMSYPIPFKSPLLVCETLRLFLSFIVSTFMCNFHNKLMHFIQGTVVFVMGMVKGFPRTAMKNLKEP